MQQKEMKSLEDQMDEKYDQFDEFNLKITHLLQEKNELENCIVLRDKKIQELNDELKRKGN